VTCSLRNDPIPFGDYWIDGDPDKSGIYLVRVDAGGNPWVFVFDVYVGLLPGADRVLYGNHTGLRRGYDLERSKAIAHAPATGENFNKALEECLDARARITVGHADKAMDLWRCEKCGKECRCRIGGGTIRIGCEWCKSRDSVVLIEKNHVRKTISCPRCSEPFCVKHHAHLDECGCTNEGQNGKHNGDFD